MIFVDRSIPVGVAHALQAVRSDVIWLEDRFAHDVKDRIWLEAAGTEGWLVVSRDKKIRTRPGERRAIRVHHVGAFILTQNENFTRWQYLKQITASLDEMQRLFDSTTRPFIYGLSGTGRLTRIDW